jgi:hypothetical protein
MYAANARGGTMIRQEVMRIIKSVLPMDTRDIDLREIHLEVHEGYRRVTITLPREPFGEEERRALYLQLESSIRQTLDYGTFVFYRC